MVYVGISPLEPHFDTLGRSIEAFGGTVFEQILEHVVRFSVQYGMDGMFSCDVLYLSATELVRGCQGGGIVYGKFGNHLHPYLATDRGIRLVEPNLVEETALESSIEVFLQVGGSDEDAVERLHLLKDDVLDGVLHLVHGIAGTALASADNGIGLVEEQDGGQSGAPHHIAIAVEEGLDVLLRVAHPLALYLGHVHNHYVAPCLTGHLIYGLCLARTGSAIEEAGKALTETSLLHALADAPELVGSKEPAKFLYLVLDALGIEKLFGSERFMGKDIGEFLLGVEYLHLPQQGALGICRELVARGVGNTIGIAVLNESAANEFVLTAAQLSLGTVIGTLVGKDALNLAETDIIIVLVDKQVAEKQKKTEVGGMQVEVIDMLHETYLRVLVEKHLHLALQVVDGDGIIAKVVKEHVEMLKECGAVQFRTLGEVVHLVVLQCTDDGLVHIEVVLVLHIAIAQKTPMHQSINIRGITQCTDMCHPKMTCKIVVVDTTRSPLHAYTEDYGLTLGDAIALGKV